MATADTPDRPQMPISDVWTLLDVLLDSPIKTKRFLGLFAFGLITTTAAGGLAVVVLLLVLPQATLASRWVWPALGTGGLANLLLLVRAWFMVRGAKAADDAGAQNPGRRRTRRSRTS